MVTATLGKGEASDKSGVDDTSGDCARTKPGRLLRSTASCGCSGVLVETGPGVAGEIRVEFGSWENPVSGIGISGRS